MMFDLHGLKVMKERGYMHPLHIANYYLKDVVMILSSFLFLTVPPSILNRRVELNPDPHFHSSRPEWCYVYYDPVYNPSEAFQLKFQWMVATTNLLSTLVRRGSVVLLLVCYDVEGEGERERGWWSGKGE